MTAQHGSARMVGFPLWLPEAARHYLEHTEAGQSIRALARASDCHPSTVLRQVRRFEGRRDDPLIDAALTSLSTEISQHHVDREKDIGKMNIECWKADAAASAGLTQGRIDQEAKRVLRRLCEQGAVLAVVQEMPTAVVVRDSGEGDQLKTATVDREIAQAMALKDWITCADTGGRVSRYYISNAGRSALRRLTAEDENRASGFGEPRKGNSSDSDWDIVAIEGLPTQPSRYYAAESPLVGLARRKDRDGQPFLKRELVAAGERLREDFELWQVRLADNNPWESCMQLKVAVDTPKAIAAAADRVRQAMDDLGPGLGDVVLRCCCLLEGLEQTEKKMGWSARSGKIVLRIALQRLKRHYAAQGDYGPMIG